MGKIYTASRKNVMATNQFKLKAGLRRRASGNYTRAQRASSFYSKLSPCAAKYAMSLIDPVSENTRGACIPQGFPMPSQKVRAFVRGTCGTQAQLAGAGLGLGYIMLIPAIANDATMVKSTQASITGNATNSSAFNNATAYNTNNVNMTKLPYSTAELASGQVEGRFISGCIRVRIVSQESNRAGTMTLLETPDHEDLLPQSLNDINQYEASTTQRPNGEGNWTQINWSGPAKTGEVTYTTAPTVTNGAGVMMIHFQSGLPAATGAQVYEYECWVNVEYVGKITVGKTNVEIDAQGFGSIQQAVKKVSATQPLNPSLGNKILSSIKAAAGHVKSWAQSPSGTKTLRTIGNVARVIASRGPYNYSNYPKYVSPKSSPYATNNLRSLSSPIFGRNPYNL